MKMTKNLILAFSCITQLALAYCPDSAKADCKDTERSTSFNKQGTVTIFNALTNTVTGTYIDTCLESGSKLTEYSCKTDGTLASQTVPCQNGCVRGACLSAPTAGLKGCYLEVNIWESITDLGGASFELRSIKNTFAAFQEKLRPVTNSLASPYRLIAYDNNSQVIGQYALNSGTELAIDTWGATTTPKLPRARSRMPISATIPYDSRLAFLAVSYGQGKLSFLNKVKLIPVCGAPCITKFKVGIAGYDSCCAGLQTVPMDTLNFTCEPSPTPSPTPTTTQTPVSVTVPAITPTSTPTPTATPTQTPTPANTPAPSPKS